MSKDTKISWAHSTASPWFGCTEVSPGCIHCYAREMTLKRGWAGWGDVSPRVRSKGFWKDVPKWNAKAERMAALAQRDSEEDPLTPTGYVRPRIFPSLMDWLDPKVPIEWLADFLHVIHDTPNLDWLLLTKRPELFHRRMCDAMNSMKDGPICDLHSWAIFDDRYPSKPWPNVWIGVTCEDQKRADERIPELLKIPARVRFLSVEPLLEKVDLLHQIITPRNHTMLDKPELPNWPKIHWVIVGGESGNKRRDCGVEAICDVARQCVAAGVPVWVKQDCAQKPGQQGRIPDEIWRLKQLPR